MPETKCNNRRNLIAFFLFGLTNNFAYVIMLSAATDILKPTAHNETAQNRTGMLIPHCNPIGTGAVLLADIIPAFVIKLSLPLVLHKMPFGLRVFGTVLLAAASFPIVSQSPWLWLSLLGVVLASASSGLGELTFLSLSAHFDKNSVSTWSSGTGAAGVSGAASYAGFRAAGVNPRITLLIMLVVPLAMLCTYNPLLVRPNSVKSYKRRNETDEDEPLLGSAAINAEARPTWRTNIRLLPNLLRYIIPLTVVYFCEYFINQALFELITFASWIPINEQYRWYQLLYQIGVFISRSSVNLIHIRKLWIFAVLQVETIKNMFSLQHLVLVDCCFGSHLRPGVR